MSDYLINPDWGSTRAIYRKLSKEMHVLTDAYNLDVDDRTLLMMDNLILAIDEVDQIVDQMPTENERNDISYNLLNYLENKDEELIHKLTTESLSNKM